METTVETMKAGTEKKNAFSSHKINSKTILIKSHPVIKNSDKINAFKQQFLKYAHFTGRADSIDEVIQKREQYTIMCNLFVDYNASELSVKQNPELKDISESVIKTHNFFEEDLIISVAKIASELLFGLEKFYKKIKSGTQTLSLDSLTAELTNYKVQSQHLDKATIYKSKTLQKAFDLINKIENELKCLK